MSLCCLPMVKYMFVKLLSDARWLMFNQSSWHLIAASVANASCLQYTCIKSMARQLLSRCGTLLSGSSVRVDSILQHRCQQVTCVVRMSVWERDKKAGYGKPSDVPATKMVKDGVKMIGEEVGLFCDEWKEKFACDKLIHIEHGDYEKIWKFQDRKSVEDWVVTADRDNSEGHSQAHFIFSKNNTGLFHGHLSQQVPKDGIVKRTGYCNIRSPTQFVSCPDIYMMCPYTIKPMHNFWSLR